jgi:transcriptional regulator with XRE-family HTH domain
VGWSVEQYKGHENARLIKLMDYKGYTMQRLSRESGVSQKALWQVVNGRTYPRVDTLLLICKVLNCSIDYLFPIEYTGGEGSEKPANVLTNPLLD